MRLLILSFLLTIQFIQVNAQSSINSANGNIKGNDGSVSYSIGQLFYTNSKNNDGSIAHGIQQPLEISIITSTVEGNEFTLSTSIYPNPTTDYITLEINSLNSGNITYQIVDINGNVLKQEDIIKCQTLIEMNNLTPSSYFLKIVKNGNEVKNYKLIKH